MYNIITHADCRKSEFFLKKCKPGIRIPYHTLNLISISHDTLNEYTTRQDIHPATLYFNIGKTVLSEKELQHLDFIATNLLTKADKDTKIYITLLGKADSNTGTMKRNQYLSEARGKYIYTLLTEKYDISPDRLIVQSEVVAAPSDPTLTRSVVIKF